MSHEQKKHNILIVDDTPMQIRVLSRILAPLYDLKVATNGKKGIELAEKHDIDLILLDIVMEDMSGFEVLEELKLLEKTKNIPVIFTTSMDTVEGEIKGLSVGAVDYITKPFSDEIVRLRVGLHLKLIEQMRIIERSTMLDSLTGLQNRHSFNHTLKTEWEKSIENGQCISMIMLDIDKFKVFNDTFGHLGGDKCLKMVADVLQLRDIDLVFRWGGEEFAVILPNSALASAEAIAERLRKNVETKPIEYEDEKFTQVTISLGVGTIYPTDSDKPENFCYEVDKMLYKAKENGRNRVESVLL
ncbi:MAG: diguanylate cyclase [Turicibacter sp.]|nr:diguanylate cyclase [Turicibacter sp.]